MNKLAIPVFGLIEEERPGADVGAVRSDGQESQRKGVARRRSAVGARPIRQWNAIDSAIGGTRVRIGAQTGVPQVTRVTIGVTRHLGNIISNSNSID